MSTAGLASALRGRRTRRLILDITSAEDTATQGCARSADRGVSMKAGRRSRSARDADRKAINPRGLGTASHIKQSSFPSFRRRPICRIIPMPRSSSSASSEVRISARARDGAGGRASH